MTEKQKLNPSPSFFASQYESIHPIPITTMQLNQPTNVMTIFNSGASRYLVLGAWENGNRQASQAMVESSGHRSTAPAAAGFFRVPGLFVRLSSKGGVSNAVDPDSVWSPTSPLDLKHLIRCSPPRACLGLADALTADESGSLHLGGRSSFVDSIKPFLDLALPKAACGKKAASASSAGVVAATLGKASEYADCEEYTCVISRGANPRTTHILAGETVEVCEGDAGAGCRKVVFSIEPLSDQRPSTSSSPAAPAGVASGRCCCCMRRLLEDRDIFIYRGEKAFCSSECRKGYIEEAEELMIPDPALNL